MTRRSPARPWLVPTLVGSVAALGASALYALAATRKAERRTPPIGQFMTIDGLRLHYIERGHGEPLVLIHGNGTLIQDFLVSGIVDDLAKRHRVIIFDRPGYGYSDRPRGSGRPAPTPPCSRRRWSGSTCRGPSCSAIPGARWWRSPWRCRPRTWCAASSWPRATTIPHCAPT